MFTIDIARSSDVTIQGGWGTGKWMGVDKSKNDKSENSNISFPLFTKIEVNTK